MAQSERLSALIAQLRTLDPARDGVQRAALLAEAATLVDRDAEPKKWAALRGMYAQTVEASDSRAALAAYLDALTVWTPDADRESWAACHMNAGMLLMRLGAPGSPSTDEAIAHLQVAVDDFPFLARALATLYRFKVSGDPAENWKQRMRYLRLALEQTSQQDAPAEWASYQNEIGIALGEEPNADYAQAVEKRIAAHVAALGVLDAARDRAAWIDTTLNLSEAYQFRVLGDKRENETTAERHVREAIAALTPESTADLRRRAYLALGRLLCDPGAAPTNARIEEALDWFARAAEAIDPEQRPELIANVEALRVNAYGALIRQGETRWLQPLNESVDAALRGFDPHIHADARRSLLQVQAEALLEVCDYAAARASLERALAAGEDALAQATTLDGRVERVFQFADSAALLCYCDLELGDIPGALEALDRGKTRLWRGGGNGIARALRDVVPSGGTALFPVFAWRKGAVIVVAHDGDALRHECVWLPAFGKAELMALQRGDPATGKLGGWLAHYAFRRSAPDDWLRAIDAVGGVLHEAVWKPVLAGLDAFGIAHGAELVWFPQGGSGVLPMHAAWHEDDVGRHWLLEEHAVRYAPSVHALRSKASSRSIESTAIVANPTGDLPFADLECAWVQRLLAEGNVRTLHGAQATREAVLAALTSSDLVHLATHATFDLTDPFASRIAVADGQTLTLQELLPVLGDRAPSFIALSACESGMARVTAMPDEFIGFPAALLEHGVRTVLSTLWPVDDAASSALIQRFYAEYRKGDVPVAEALRRAQNWLRNATVGELAQLLAELRGEPAPVGPFAARLRARLFGLDDALRPFAHPYFWAAFTAWGE